MTAEGSLISNILLTCGVLVFTLALRSFRHPVLQKLSVLGVVSTSFLIGFFLTGYWVGGLMFAALWLVLPWVDLLTRIRKLSIPMERSLRHRTPPNSSTFPALKDLTDEIEGEGFEYVEDTGWEWEGYQQFFRLFYRPDERLQAAVCMVDQQDVAFFYISISSRSADGTNWTTWNYPFSYSLKLAPEWRVNRCRGDMSFLQILEEHRDWLRRQGVNLETVAEVDPGNMPTEIQKDLRSQIAHNLAAGVLVKDSTESVRYSWRGLLFLWVQFLRDIVRLQ